MTQEWTRVLPYLIMMIAPFVMAYPEIFAQVDCEALEHFGYHHANKDVQDV